MPLCRHGRHLTGMQLPICAQAVSSWAQLHQHLHPRMQLALRHAAAGMPQSPSSFTDEAADPNSLRANLLTRRIAALATLPATLLPSAA